MAALSDKSVNKSPLLSKVARKISLHKMASAHCKSATKSPLQLRQNADICGTHRNVSSFFSLLSKDSWKIKNFFQSKIFHHRSLTKPILVKTKEQFYKTRVLLNTRSLCFNKLSCGTYVFFFYYTRRKYNNLPHACALYGYFYLYFHWCFYSISEDVLCFPFLSLFASARLDEFYNNFFVYHVKIFLKCFPPIFLYIF